jgi:hypothetical protein
MDTMDVTRLFSVIITRLLRLNFLHTVQYGGVCYLPLLAGSLCFMEEKKKRWVTVAVGRKLWERTKRQ